MKRGIGVAIFSCAVVFSGSVAAAESFQIATELGNMLASEEVCGLTYNQQAIETYISKNVAPEDMEFTGSLSMMTLGAKVNIRDMSASAKTAHCAQIKRTARHYGFTE